MSDFFGTEIERSGKFREILRDHGIDILGTAIDHTDGDMQFKGLRYILSEMKNEKNEIGSNGAGPHAQAISYYIHSTKRFVSENPGFRFPCILFALFGKFPVSGISLSTDHGFTGPYIDFSAAVWSTRPNIQVLSTALPLFNHHTDTKMRTIAARYFGALRKAIHSPKRCYQEMASNPSSYPSPAPDFEFPYPYSYTCLNTSLIHHFSYIVQMDDHKPLFVAKKTDGETICIKFVRRYSKDVHQLCASMGFAPVLKGFEDLPGR